MRNATPDRSGHLDFVTGLRGLAAFFVLLSHVWYEIWPAVAPPYGYGRHPEGVTALLTGWLYYGHFGVVVFIVLSGFCLMLPVLGNGGYLRGGAAGFLARRAWRILPPYYAAMILALLMIWLWIGTRTGTQWDISIPVTSTGILSHLLLLQDVVEPTQINYVFWSIAVEVHLYLLFPALVWSWRRFGAMRTTAAACAVVYGVILLLEAADWREVPPAFVGLCAYFLFGMAAADRFVRMRSDGGDGLPWSRISLALTASVVILCAAWGREVAESHFAILDTLCALATVGLLLAAGRPGAGQRLRRALGSARLVWLGTFSYSLYLMHAPILHLVWTTTIDPWFAADGAQFLALLLLGVPAGVAGAWLFFLAFERPFLAKAVKPAVAQVIGTANTA